MNKVGYEALLARLDRLPTWVLQLAFRIGMAGVFFASGLQKLRSWDATVQLFAEEYRVPLIPPALAAHAAAAVELVCPVLLILGLATRLATLPMLGMCVVIGALVYPQSFYEQVLWAGALLFLLSKGPGPLSVDYMLRRVFLAKSGA